ncbi:MAG: MFS transporter, partial [Muribaculaceae bacterium]|nr:MFS transporter [Muribaculaceae bacterium]
LVPVIPLLLLPFMTNTFIRKHIRPAETGPAVTDENEKISESSQYNTLRHPIVTLFGVIGLYVALTATSMVFTYYLPFTMKHYGLTTSQVGIATAMFYVTAMIGGFSLTPYLRFAGKTALYVCIVIMTVGLLMLGLLHTMPAYVAGVLLIGLGYGLFQPVIYNKTTRIAPDKTLSTKYFSYTLAGNYVAVSIVPVLVELFERIFNNHTADFPYYLSASILGIVFIIGLLKRDSFVWRTYRKEPQAPSKPKS